MRTKGKVHIKHEHVVKRADDDRMIAVCGNHTNNRDDYRTWEENIHNAAFIAMCFNTAHALDGAGFDGENAIRELPEIISALLLCAESLNCLAASVGIPVEGASPKSDKSDDYGANVSLAVARAALDKIRGDK